MFEAEAFWRLCGKRGGVSKYLTGTNSDPDRCGSRGYQDKSGRKMGIIRNKDSIHADNVACEVQ